LIQGVGSKILPDRQTVDPVTNEAIKNSVKALLKDCVPIG
jgi:hypothetical protein